MVVAKSVPMMCTADAVGVVCELTAAAAAPTAAAPTAAAPTAAAPTVPWTQ